MSKTQLTRGTYDRLRAELTELTGRGRVEIADAIEKARALGDLSENGDYHAAKDAQGHMEARIRKLEYMLDNAEVAEQMESDVVIVGSVVGLRYEGDDDVERFLVGSIEERRDDVTIVSPGSPLGEALLSKKAGDVVSYEAPNGAQLKVEIVDVGL